MLIRAAVFLGGLAAVAAALTVERGVVIQKPKVVTKSIAAAKAIDDFRTKEKKRIEIEDFARNTLGAAPGARKKQFEKVLVAQGEAKAAAEVAQQASQEMMEDVQVEDAATTQEP